MTATHHLGLDLGGTNIKTAVLEQSRRHADHPELVHSARIPTNAQEGPEAVADRLIAAGREAMDQFAGITTVGLGVPGLFDIDTGVIKLFPNLPGQWAGNGLRDTVSRGLDMDVAMINDARAFTLAEGTIGSGQGAHVMLGITLGTGIGGGIMVDGQLYLGAVGIAGEFGHQTVVADGPLCGCGNHGCLEAVARAGVVASGAGFADVESLYSAFQTGRPAAIEAIERANMYMAIGISNTVSLLGVDVVVVGGGVATPGPLVLEPLQRAVNERVTLVPTQDIRIVSGALGSTAGAIGAALVGMNQALTRSL